MTAPDWIAALRLIPQEDVGKLVIVLQNGTELCVDTLLRFESNFLVMRGRQGGTIEEARGFFVPYDQFLCLRLDRIMKLEELDDMFGGQSPPPRNVAKDTPINSPSLHPTPTAPTDPAEASRLLLDRIRAVRASSAPRYASKQG